jgi:hypothetical protein
MRHRTARDSKVPRSRLLLAALVVGALAPGCGVLPFSSHHGELSVREVTEPIVVAAWAEPRALPHGGGQAQILIRVQKQGGARFPGVEVRLQASEGSLFSDGRTLVTDTQGMTRDRLTTHRSAVVTLNAGGTRYRFQVPVAEPAAEPAQ